MRRGLMRWREEELAAADVTARQRRLQQKLAHGGLDALLVYTNHVRSAGVTYLTGFTPYWSDAILLVPREGAPLFATALSKRVGNWIRSVNPTSEIAHSPQPGRLIGERLSRDGTRRVGVLELERLPGVLVQEIRAVAAVELVDATALFTDVRGVPDRAELALVTRAEAIARAAFAETDRNAATIGAVTGPLERSIRLAGAEECYVAVAPDLARDHRLARLDGRGALGSLFGVRASIAYNGVWIRYTRSFSRDERWGERIDAMNAWFNDLTLAVDPAAPLARQLAGKGAPPGVAFTEWHAEAPVGTRPLKTIAGATGQSEGPFPYLVLCAAFQAGDASLLVAGPAHSGSAAELAA